MPRVTGVKAQRLPTDFKSLVKMHPPSAIRDDVDYRSVQEVIDALTRLPTLSPGQARYLETLTILFAAYEDGRHPIDASGVTPLDVLRALVREHGMTASDLGRLLGERSLGSKVLTGGRTLSKANVRTLADHFGVSADLFL